MGDGIGAFSGDGGPASSARIYNPNGITLDLCGNLYIVDNGNYRIRKVTFNPPPCDYLAVNEQTTVKHISIYPNPASDKLYIDDVRTNTFYQMCSTVGAVVQSGNLKEGSNNISIKHWPPGMYMLVLTDEKGMRTVHKIVKE